MRRGTRTGRTGDDPPFLSLSLLSFSFNRGRGRGRLEYDAWDVKSSKRSPGISCGQRFLRGSVIEDGCETSPVCKTRMSLSPGRHPALPRRGSHRSSLARRREQLLLSCPYPTTLQLECRGVTPEKNASLTNYAGPGYTLVCQHSPLPLFCHRAQLCIHEMRLALPRYQKTVCTP